MSYEWNEMRKLTWKEVMALHKNGELVGCFYLHSDGTEAQIGEGYTLDNLVRHHMFGGEFGIEE